MSWGYFADLQLALPSEAWKQLRLQKPGELPRGWFGLNDAGLEKSFARPLGSKDGFAKLLEAPAYNGGETICTVEEAGGVVRVRVCLLLDKSQLELAQPLAALLEIARLHDGEGALRLVNDGTYSGEGGVAIELRSSELERRSLEDECQEIADELAGEIFAAATPKTKSGKPKINPFTGKPV
jgi:hypothetical protein